MTRAERRQHPRKDSLNLLSYICLDENDHELTQGMGRTLNVSESGILLETYRQIDTKHVLLLDIGLADDLIDIKGKVIYSKSLEWSTFRYGIQFLDMDKNVLLTLKKFIKAFRKMKSQGLTYLLENLVDAFCVCGNPVKPFVVSKQIMDPSHAVKGNHLVIVHV